MEMSIVSRIFVSDFMRLLGILDLKVVATAAVTVIAMLALQWRGSSGDRYRYYEETIRNDHCLIEVDTHTGRVSTVRPTRYGPSRFPREAKSSVAEWIRNCIDESKDAVAASNLGFTQDLTKVDKFRTAMFCGAIAATGFAVFFAVDALKPFTKRAQS